MRARSASAAVQRGSLGIHLDSGGQDLAAEQHVAFIDGQGFKVKLDGLLDIRDCLLKRASLGLATFQLRTPRVEPMIVFFNHDACFAGHGISVPSAGGSLMATPLYCGDMPDMNFDQPEPRLVEEEDAATIAAIEEGLAQLDAGQGIPLEELRREFRDRLAL